MVLEAENPLTGAFGRPETQRTPEQRERSSRRWAIFGVVMSLMWLGGFGSLIGLAAGGLARGDAKTSFNRRLATAAVVISIVGLVAAAVMVSMTIS